MSEENSPIVTTERQTPELTDKQRRFCEEYLIDLNATRAAQRAGYSGSDETLAVTGHEVLRNPKVAVVIQGLMAERSRRTEVTADRVVLEIAKIAFSDMRKFARWGPGGVSLLPSDDMTDDDAVCVSEVSESTSKEGGSLKFKLHDKKGALELLGRHLKLFTDKSENTSTVLVDGELRVAKVDLTERVKQIKGEE